jgi:hypothetical protein
VHKGKEKEMETVVLFRIKFIDGPGRRLILCEKYPFLMSLVDIWFVARIFKKRVNMENEISIPEEVIASKIYLIRGRRVMLAGDLAELYQVETKRINEQVKRNPRRFPDRYMFQLSENECDSLRSQFATLKNGQHFRYLPYAFTEHGILMLSSVLRSERADRVNLLIIDTFVKLTEMMLTNRDILLQFELMEKRVSNQDKKILEIFTYLKQFIKQEGSRRKIGFVPRDLSRVKKAS